MSRLRTLKSGLVTCTKGQELIEYAEDVDIMIAYEFSIYNLGEDEVSIKFNNDGDELLLDPGEGFDTLFPLSHIIVNTEGAVVKYSYWI